MEKKPEKTEEKKPDKVEAKVEEKSEKVEAKAEEKPTEKKKDEKKITKKEEAVTLGNNIHISMKQGMHICKFIKGKSIDAAISDLEDVLKFKKAVPFTGEIPHRKGDIMSGRYPMNASKAFITLLKTLRGNVLVNQMDLDKTKIYFASSSYAARPSKKKSRRFKRSNIILKAKEAIK